MGLSDQAAAPFILTKVECWNSVGLGSRLGESRDFGDGAEGEVDAGGGGFFGFGEGVEPVGLGFIEHEEEVAVFEEDGGAEGGVFFVLEVEAAGGAEAEGGDGGVAEEHGFVVAVPGHAFGAGVVEVGETGVVGGAGGGFDAGFEGGEGGGPGLGGAGDAGVGIGEGVVAVPRDFAGGDDAFAKEADFVVLPGEFGEEGGEGGGGVGVGEEGAEGMDDAVLGEEVRGHGCQKSGNDWGRGNYAGKVVSERKWSWKRTRSCIYGGRKKYKSD